MKLVRTVKLQLECSPAEFNNTVELYTQAFNTVCAVGWADKDFNGVSLHHKTYRKVSELLPSQLKISSRMKATEALKSVRKKPEAACPVSKRSSVRYDARSYNVMFDKNIVSLLTTEGRKKFGIKVPEYFKKYLAWRRTTADLFIRGNKVFLHIVFEKEVESPKLTGEVTGIDRGINKIAVTSENRFYSGKECKCITHKYRRLRSKLQACGTRSAKRHLKELSRKENRYRADVNHCVSKSIISETAPGTVLVLEDLSSVRHNRKLNKKMRTLLYNWSFFQLQEFLTYKAQEKGVAVEYVDARFTSQKCSVCGHVSRSNRTSQAQFRCRKCGLTLNADLNASRNIRQNYLAAICGKGSGDVNRPIVADAEALYPQDN